MVQPHVDKTWLEVPLITTPSSNQQKAWVVVPQTSPIHLGVVTQVLMNNVVRCKTKHRPMVKSMGGGVVLMVGHEDEDKRDNEEFIFMGFEQYNQKRKKENPL